MRRSNENAPRVAEAERLDLRAPLGRDVDRDELAESVPDVLGAVLGVAAGAAVAHADVEPAVGAERDLPAVVVRRTAGARTAVAARCPGCARVPFERYSTTFVSRRGRCSSRRSAGSSRSSGGRRRTRRPCSPPARTSERMSRNGCGADAAVLDDADAARLLDDVEPARLAAGRRDVHRRLEPAHHGRIESAARCAVAGAACVVASTRPRPRPARSLEAPRRAPPRRRARAASPLDQRLAQLVFLARLENREHLVAGLELGLAACDHRLAVADDGDEARALGQPDARRSSCRCTGRRGRSAPRRSRGSRCGARAAGRGRARAPRARRGP